MGSGWSLFSNYTKNFTIIQEQKLVESSVWFQNVELFIILDSPENFHFFCSFYLER